MADTYMTIHTSTTSMRSTAAEHDTKLNAFALQGWEPGETTTFFAEHYYQMVTVMCYEPKGDDKS